MGKGAIKLKEKCTIPDCNNDSICKTKISINNEPPKLLPVCQIHFESVLEDHMERIKHFIQLLKGNN
jgi:hypothetical protein